MSMSKMLQKLSHVAYRVAGVALLCALVVTPSFAQEESESRDEKVYLKANVGEFTWVNFCENQTGVYSVPSAHCSDRSAGYSAVVGYRFNEFLGVEVGGQYADKFEVESGSVQGAFRTESDFGSYTIGATGRFPLDGEMVALNFRGGLSSWTTETAEYLAGSAIRQRVVHERDGIDFYYGGGIEFRVNNHASFGADYAHNVVEDDSIDAFTWFLVISL